MLVAAVLGVFSASCCPAGEAERYLDAELRALASVEGQLQRIADAAEVSAARLLAGGNIYLAGERGMIAELSGRAGGLCAAKRLSLDGPVTLATGDVVLLSDYGTPGKLTAALEKLTPSKALVIVFASAEQPALKSIQGKVTFRDSGRPYLTVSNRPSGPADRTSTSATSPAPDTNIRTRYRRPQESRKPSGRGEAHG